MRADAPGPMPRRAAPGALLLVVAAVALAAAGAAWFFRSVALVRRDPGVLYRDPTTLDALLKRANDAERAGDRAAAIATYRFVAAVGDTTGRAQEAGGAQGVEVARYVAAARAGLRRLGVADTLRGLPH